MPMLPTRWPQVPSNDHLDVAELRPDPAADAVLAVGFDRKLLGPVPDRLLDLLFEIFG